MKLCKWLLRYNPLDDRTQGLKAIHFVHIMGVWPSALNCNRPDFSLSLIPIDALVTAKRCKRLIGCNGTQAGKLFDPANQTASECFSSIRTVAAFSLAPHVTALYKEQLHEPTRIIGKTAQVSGIGFGFSQGVMFLVSALTQACCRRWAVV